MKNRIVILLFNMMLMSALFCSCSKDDSLDDADNNKTEVVTDNYYVKYETETGAGLEIRGSVVTDRGNYSFSDDISETFGPVSKGFYANISTSYIHRGIGNSSDYKIRIYVSKNKEPFALKATISSNYNKSYNQSLSYVIDF